MKVFGLFVLAAVSIGTGCSPLVRGAVSQESEENIVGWRLVNRPIETLEEQRLADAAQITAVASVLVFEPIHAGDEIDGDLSGIVRLEVTADEDARVGEFFTARISIPDAEEDDRTLVELRTTNDWTKIEGPVRLVLRGPEVRTVRFTSSTKGRAGIRILARRLQPTE